MHSSEELAGMIIQRFAKNGAANSIRSRYQFVEFIPDGVRISRETGTIWDIKKQYIIMAIEAVKNEPAIYNAGPFGLRAYINRRIQSPLWALLHLLTLVEIMNLNE